MRVHPSILFAWYGSGKRWDDLRLQSFGCAIGGFLFWDLGLKVPQEILENPALGALAGIVVGGISGAAIVFVLRLCWYPLHSIVESNGGYRAVRSSLGKGMSPAILMILGVIFFVLLFGGGAIWLVLDQQQLRPDFVGRPKNAPSALPRKTAELELSFEDRQFRLEARRFVLSDCLTLIQAFSEAFGTILTENSNEDRNRRLNQSYNIFSNSGAINASWQEAISYAQRDVENIDPEILSEKIVSLLKVYRSESIVVEILEERAPHSDKFNKLRLADRQAKDAFSRLRNSTSKYLKDSSPFSFFSSTD